jgi:CDGSH-type Zn-finger protein
MEPVAFPLGEHLVLEADGNLVCQKCGRSSPLTEADKFAETDCKTTQETVIQPKTQTQPQQNNERCVTCRLGEGKNKTPMLDPMTGQINQKLLCDNCFKDYLRILRFSGPRFGRVKARAPPNGVWFSYGENAGSILFTQISGTWPCPACDEFYENLYDAVTHLAEKHPELANKPNEKIIEDVNGKPVEVLRTAQGYLICQCGFLAENVKHFTYHYDRDHKQVQV